MIDQNTNNKLLLAALNSAIPAGKAIMEVYRSENYHVQTKTDQSPLTLADKRAHEIISKELSSCGFPILSEEGKLLSYEERKNWDIFWLVDPLDGTKEFINKNGEFTVNIALIENNVPIMGVVYLPVPDILYFGSKTTSSYKLSKASECSFSDLSVLINHSEKLPCMKGNGKFTVVGSKSHSNQETVDFVRKLEQEHKEVAFVSYGSSLKFCKVAEGAANLYPRLGTTMEWDTAAGHAIVTFAGGQVKQYLAENPLHYNKEDLRNPWFIVEC